LHSRRRLSATGIVEGNPLLLYPTTAVRLHDPHKPTSLADSASSWDALAAKQPFQCLHQIHSRHHIHELRCRGMRPSLETKGVDDGGMGVKEWKIHVHP